MGMVALEKYKISAAMAIAIVTTSFVFSPAFGGNKTGDAFALGIAAGIGTAILQDLQPQAQPGTHVATPPFDPPAEYDPTIYLIQRALNILGFNAGPNDGIAGAATRNAVMNYQESLGNPVTGSLTPQEFRNLEMVDRDSIANVPLKSNVPLDNRVSDSPPRVIPSPSELDEPIDRIEQSGKIEQPSPLPLQQREQVSRSDPTLLKIQQELYARGYEVGPRDGVSGEQTKAAIKQYQISLGSTPTGFLTPKEYKILFGAGDQPQGLAVQRAGIANRDNTD